MKRILNSLFISLLLSPVCEGKNFFGALEKIQKKYGEQSDSKLMLYLSKSHYYYSALSFAKDHLGRESYPSVDFEKAFDKLVIKLGKAPFDIIPLSSLSHSKSPGSSYLRGLRYFDQKKFKEAVKILGEVPDRHPLKGESLYFTGYSHYALGEKLKALDALIGCQKEVEYSLAKESDKKKRRFYQVMSERCLVGQARIHYKSENYILSMQAYEKIDKRSYIWPNILLEKAWNSYVERDFNRSLGLLVTYKSPLLGDYFFPEAEVLRALNYFELCLYDDSLKVVTHFHEKYAERSAGLVELLSKKHSPSFFYEQMFAEESVVKIPFFQNLLNQIKKKPRFNFTLWNLRRLLSEQKRMRKKQQNQLTTSLLKSLDAMGDELKKSINNYIVSKLTRFTNEMNRFSEEMYNINLEVFLMQKNIAYESKLGQEVRKRGGLENVKRKKNQYYFTFNGEFWADEIGDYSFGLKSACKEI